MKCLAKEYITDEKGIQALTIAIYQAVIFNRYIHITMWKRFAVQKQSIKKKLLQLNGTKDETGESYYKWSSSSYYLLLLPLPHGTRV